MIQWCRRCWKTHSLSMSLTTGALVCTAVSKFVEYGTWWCDFWLSVATGFWTALVVTVLSKFTWEKDADPTKPPEQSNDIDPSNPD